MWALLATDLSIVKATLVLVGFLGSNKAWRKLLEQDQRCVCTLGFTSSSGLHIKGSISSLKRLFSGGGGHTLLT